MDKQVTKTKSEGRVSSGKRLAEWNRKNKEDLLKNKGQVDTGGDQVPDQVPASHQGWMGIGALVLIGGGIVVYFYTREKPTQAPLEVKKQAKKYME